MDGLRRGEVIETAQSLHGSPVLLGDTPEGFAGTHDVATRTGGRVLCAGGRGRFGFTSPGSSGDAEGLTSPDEGASQPILLLDGPHTYPVALCNATQRFSGTDFVEEVSGLGRGIGLGGSSRRWSTCPLAEGGRRWNRPDYQERVRQRYLTAFFLRDRQAPHEVLPVAMEEGPCKKLAFVGVARGEQMNHIRMR